MLINFLKPTFRSLRKHKSYSLFNIIGLAIGVTGAFLISLYITHELSYDKDFKRSEDIFRLGIEYNFSGKIDRFCNLARPIGPKLKADFPEVEEYTRMAGLNGMYTHTAMIEFNNRIVKSDKMFYADSSYFQIFEHEFLAGIPNVALVEPNSLVILESMALKIFGNSDALGKTVKLDDGSNVKITGVIKDPEGNTHMPFDGLVSWSTIHTEADNSTWLGRHVYTYVMLYPQTNAQILLDKYEAFYQKYMADIFSQYDATNTLIIQPLTSIHLNSNLTWEAYPNSNIVSVYIYGAIAILLIILSCINYINLETARLVTKMKDVGIKKVLGANKGYLILQGLVESILISLIAVILSAILSLLILPYYNALSGIELSLNYLEYPEYLLFLMTFGVLIGIISGILPAIYKARFKPVETLNNKSSYGYRSPILRKVLVTIQLTVSVGLIIGALSIDNQVEYMKNIDPGFATENIMMINLNDTSVTNNMASIKSSLLSIPGISGVARAADTPGNELNQSVANVTKGDGERGPTGIQFMEVDFDYLKLMDIEVIEGRFFDRSFSSDLASAIIVNETARIKFDWQDKSIGQKVDFGPNSDGTIDDYFVVGVIRDIHASSLHHEIQPLMIFPNDNITAPGKLFVKMEGNNMEATIAGIEALWQRSVQKKAPEYSFVNEHMSRKYLKDEKAFSLISYFAYLTIIISTLGLFGLVSFTTAQRRKEVSIRKVLGSSVSKVLILLSKEFILLIVVANILAWPLAYFGVNDWMENFAYRAGFDIWVIILAAFISVLVTIITISYHTLNTARSNPVDHLRNE